MKTVFPRRLERSGFVFLLVLFTLTAMILVLGGVMFWISSSVKQTAKNSMFTTSQAAAEGATEMVFAEMDRDFLKSSLGTAGSYDQLLPDETGWPIQFNFDDGQGNTNQINVNIGNSSGGLQQLGDQYVGLQGYIQIITVTATATPISQLYNQPSTVEQQFSFATVPAFQFAIFYNINLEIDPGAAMPIAGSVFSNGGIWTGGSNPTFSSTVEAAGLVNTTGTDPFLTSYTTTAIPQSNFQKAGQPVSGVDPLEIPIGASTNNSESNVIAIIQIPPSSVAAPQIMAYSHTNQVYTFNEAALIVSNWASGTFSATPSGNNFSVYLQDNSINPSFHAPITGHWNQLTNDFYSIVATKGTNSTIFGVNNLTNAPGFSASAMPATGNPWSPGASENIAWTSGGTNYTVRYAGWTWLTNVQFYDYREGKTVQAVQIDVSQLRTWITNSAAVNGATNWNYALAYDRGYRGAIDSVYVYNNVSLTSSQLPAVRMVNGLRLPNSTNFINNTNNITSGLTVVTPQPLYVLGNYNAQTDGDSSATTYLPGTNNMAHTYPAAFMADSITILSGNWLGHDSTYVSGTALSSRNPSSTVINAACLEGIVQSSATYPHTGGVDGYSGGVENFLRLLENWSSSTPLTYNGSIMVMFPSQYATNWWQQTSYYYNAPKRVWSFDTAFTNQDGLPPLTPQFTLVQRTNYFNF